MTRTEHRLNITPGTLYSCHVNGWGRRDHLYQLVGIALAHPGFNELVIYDGVDGPDAGKMFACSLSEFAACFREEKVVVKREKEAAAASVVDMSERGKGW